ncbi:protein FAR1-RELATED SEQUENCE 5-like [Cornus florida]|uniref:protein FAR1-RELATED SEQUENCE 5-like n=1 Tax=Cornus florida TaxID=4283 RepID=UPI00289DD126|nr:protein FAR1-RELATED SEQUENCE 5-like [Cornus florida]
MEFDMEQEAYEFYNAYGGRVGFSIQMEYFSNSRKTEKLLTRLFTCYKEGVRKKDRRDKHTTTPRVETRTGCGARIHIKYDEAKGKYLVDNFLDAEQMITNILWADPKMITDYGHFGDVVTFDTTYKLLHGNCPFALFLGVNQHQETTVFGAALMYDETSDSFVWLFDTFLKAMPGKIPKTILTD